MDVICKHGGMTAPNMPDLELERRRFTWGTGRARACRSSHGLHEQAAGFPAIGKHG